MENYGSCTGLKKSTHLFFRNVLSKGLATKADEFSEKCQGGGGVIFNPKNYPADYGNLKQGFLSIKLSFFNNCMEKNQNKTHFDEGYCIHISQRDGSRYHIG